MLIDIEFNHRKILFRNWAGIIFVIFIVLQLPACSSVSLTSAGSATDVFYPPLPNKPKIQFLTTINTTQSGESAGGLNKPYGVSYYQGQIFVVDSRGSKYYILNADGSIKRVVTGSGKSEMINPINIYIDKEGKRYISDTGRNEVLLFDANDNYVMAFGIKNQFKPADALINGNFLYVSDLKHHRIHVLDKFTGVIRGFIGKRGSRQGELFFPTNLALGPKGNLFVSDTGNYRVQVFSPRGKFLKSYGEAGSGLGQFARPKGISVDRRGRVYAIDSAFENIQVFNRRGQLLLFFGAPGNAPDNINMPADISISYEGISSFQKYAHERFSIEYLMFVSNQFGPNKITVYGFGDYR